MAPLAAALATAIEKIEVCKRLRQHRYPESMHGVHRSAARSRHHRGGDGRGRSVGARGAPTPLCALPRARRHAVAARRRRPAGSLDRCADSPRVHDARRHRGDPRPQCHRRTARPPPTTSPICCTERNVKVTRLAHGGPGRGRARLSRRGHLVGGDPPAHAVSDAGRQDGHAAGFWPRVAKWPRAAADRRAAGKPGSAVECR